MSNVIDFNARWLEIAVKLDRKHQALHAIRRACVELGHVRDFSPEAARHYDALMATGRHLCKALDPDSNGGTP